MTEQDDEVAAALDRVERTEALAIDIVLPHVAGFAPFLGLPDEIKERRLPDFGKLAGTNSVTRLELLEMAGKDLRRYIRALRTMTTLYPQIDASRLAVLAHVAMVIGHEALKDCKELWAAISKKSWEDAADVLLMTQWPERAIAKEDRRRVLELARMMRNGTLPLGLPS